MAVPGSRRNPAAAGTNELLRRRCLALHRSVRHPAGVGLTPGSRRRDHREPPRGDAAAVLHACGGEPATFDQIASRTALAPAAVVSAVRELERAGWMERSKGLCWPRGASDPPARAR